MIKARHIAAEGENTSDLGVAAAIDALNDAGIEPSGIDMIVLATSTPDLTFPATATAIQAALGITRGFAFDLQAVCSGFSYALATADNFLRLGQAKRALVIGAETFSRILDWEDRGTCVLFGDGAGAVVLEAQPVEDPMRERCVIGSLLRSDGRHRDKLYVDGGPSATQTVGHLRMQGKEVFRFAVNAIAEVVEATIAAHNMKPSDIDWFVPHQANKRILDGTAKKVGIDPGKVVITLDKHGNTSAASISARACHSREGWANQERRPHPFRGYGRWIYLGCQSRPLVKGRLVYNPIQSVRKNGRGGRASKKMLT